MNFNLFLSYFQIFLLRLHLILNKPFSAVLPSESSGKTSDLLLLSQPKVKAEVDLNLRLKWGWDEIESKFSWTWVEVELSCSWDKLTLNKGRNWAFIGVGLWFKICFRATYVAEQHMFSMLLLISSNQRAIFFLTFWGK